MRSCFYVKIYYRGGCDGRKMILICSGTTVSKAAVCIFLMCLSFILMNMNCVKTVGDWYSSGLLICHLGEKSGIGVQVPVTALISIMFQKPSGNFRRAFSFIIKLSNREMEERKNAKRY